MKQRSIRIPLRIQDDHYDEKRANTDIARRVFTSVVCRLTSKVEALKPDTGGKGRRSDARKSDIGLKGAVNSSAP